MDKTFAKRSHGKQKRERGLGASAALAACLSLLIGAALLPLIGAVGLSLDDPDRYTPAFALGTLFAVFFLGGVFAAGFHRQRGALAGLLTGLLLLAALLLAVFALGYAMRPMLAAVAMPVGLLLSALAGKIACREKKRAKRRF